MELQSFDLLWLAEPVEFCLHDDTQLELREIALDIDGPRTERYITELAHCPACGQVYGSLLLLHEVMADFGWDASEIEGFALADKSATAGVDLGMATIPWVVFGRQMRAMRETYDRSPPSDEEVRALNQTSTTWEIGQAPATWIGEGSDDVELGYVALVHGPTLVRATEIQTRSRFEADQLAALVRRAAGVPSPPGTPGRPRRVRVDSEPLASALGPHLSPLEIEVEVEATPLVDEALEELTALLLGDGPPPIFREASDESIQAFVETATRFYDREPWTRTEGDRFLGVQIGEGDWFFANVMGQMEESPGLSLFDDWLTVCRFVHNERSPFFALAEALGLSDEIAGAPAGPFEAAGALEGLSLQERSLLHPVDAERLDQLSIGPPVRGQYPVPIRFDADEGPVAPHFPLETYRLVMEALLIALEKRRATPVTSIKTTLDIGGTSVSLRYPSEGTERPYDGPPGYRLFIRGHDRDISSPSRIPGGERIVIEAPATALFKDVAKALGQFDDHIYEATLREWDISLWLDRGSRRNPSPRIADLVDLSQPSELEVELGGGAFSLVVDQALDRSPDTIRLERDSAEGPHS